MTLKTVSRGTEWSMTVWLLIVAQALASDGSATLFHDFHDDFESGISERWVEQGFPSIDRKNTFSLAVEADGNHYLKVESAQSSSGKGIRMRFATRQCPDVSWRWMISNTIETADITRKEGDDAAAKLYVVFDGPSRWNPLDKRILVYLWDNAQPVGSLFSNAWLPDKERMVILESGTSKAGQWVGEHVDLEKDFARAFPGEQPGTVEALAFMADTDNTSTHVSAGFDDLVIRCAASHPGE
jgi:hypothetical protein